MPSVHTPAFRLLGVGAVAVALLAAGCGSSKKGSSSTSTPATQPATTSTTGSAGGTPPAGAGKTVSLKADKGGGLSFDPKALKAKAGKVTLVMSNPSSSGLQHGVAVEGNGVDKDGQIVAPGGTSKVTVTLKPGKYEFYCPFDHHKQMGMKGTLTVS